MANGNAVTSVQAKEHHLSIDMPNALANPYSISQNYTRPTPTAANQTWLQVLVTANTARYPTPLAMIPIRSCNAYSIHRRAGGKCSLLLGRKSINHEGEI